MIFNVHFISYNPIFVYWLNEKSPLLSDFAVSWNYMDLSVVEIHDNLASASGTLFLF